MSERLLKICASCNTRDNAACTALRAFVMASFCHYNSNSIAVSITVAIAFLPYRGVVIMTLSSVAIRNVPKDLLPFLVEGRKFCQMETVEHSSLKCKSRLAIYSC